MLEKTVLKVTRRISNGSEAMLIAIVLLVVVDVALRRIFNSPLAWSVEVIEIMLVIVVFFSVAYCGARRGHVSIEIVTARFPPRVRAIVETVMNFFGVLLFGYMTYGSYIQAMKEWDTNRITGLLPIPTFPFIFVIAFGSLLLALVLLVQMINSATSVVKE